MVQADSICGKIYFSQIIDIEEGTLIQRKSETPVLAEAGPFYYDLLRPYYQQDKENFSHLHVERINAMDYLMKPVTHDRLKKSIERIHEEPIAKPKTFTPLTALK